MGGLNTFFGGGGKSRAEADLEHAKAALSAILLRCEGIARPNGTTNVIARLATAGLNGGDIEEAGQRLPRT